MVRQIVALLLFLPSLAFAGWGQRFSHPEHTAKLQLRGQPLIECKSCHQLAAGTFQPLAPGHDDHHPCTDCHGGADFSRGPHCLTCHSSVRTMKPGKPWFPPFRTPGEFHVTFGHAKHVSLAGGNDCGGCHTGQLDSARAQHSSHTSCARCHSTGSLPDMNNCGGCHKPGAAPSQSAANEPSAFRVSTFSHATHQSAAAKKSASTACSACHVGLGQMEHPDRPAMKACERCHDGRQAFDARGTHCGKCHSRALNKVSTEIMRTDEPLFSHAAHAKRGVDLLHCTQCHGAGDWRAALPGRNEHRPCQNEGCHAVEFGKLGSRLCLSCHERNDPFEPNVIKRPASRAQPEWRVAISHPSHLSSGAACVSCHAGIVEKPEPDGHALCGGCHKPNSKTTMEACAACHKPTGGPAAAARPWSVAARFAHDKNHRAQCESCHRGPGAPDLVQPNMHECAECHDGEVAFKVTGFGCARCHGAARKDAS